MLVRFTVSNFASLRDQQTLSLVASKLKGDSKGLIGAPELRAETLLPAAVIYGPNASGKSNLVKALARMRHLVLNSHRAGKPGDSIRLSPFALDPEYNTIPSIFSIDFICNRSVYEYSFGANGERFLFETLHVIREGRRSMLFERKMDEFNFGRSLKGRNKIIEDLTRSNSLFLSAATQNNHEELGNVAAFFRELQIHGITLAPGLNILELRLMSDRLAYEGLSEKVIDFLKAVNVGVADFKVDPWPQGDQLASLIARMRSLQTEPISTTMGDNVGEPSKALRLRLGHLGSGGRSFYFDLEDESSGTIQLLTVLGPVFAALDKGTTVIIDEFGSQVHTRVSQDILALFNNKYTNPKGAQLIVATHDTNLLNVDGLRRDQVWFAEKDDTGATHLYPLTDFVIRKEDNLEKGYLQGRFGAIPFSGSLTTLLSKD